MTLAGLLEAVRGGLGLLAGCGERVAGALVARFATFLPGATSPRKAEGPPAPEERRAGEVAEAKYWAGRSSVYAGSPHAAERFADRETAALPRTYGHDRVVLLARDPWTLFAYWEMGEPTRAEGRLALGSDGTTARDVLRVHDVNFVAFTGDNAWQSFDVDLPPGADRWYVTVSRPAASYCAEIGLRTDDGRFIPLVRSNTVTTPPSGPSPDTSVTWVRLRRHGLPRTTAHGWSGVRLPQATAAPGASEMHAGRDAPR